MRILRVDPRLLDLMTPPPGERAVSLDALVEAVGELPEPYRTVIDAVFWEQVPRRVLTRRLGLEKRSVTERLIREGLVILRRQMREAG